MAKRKKNKNLLKTVFIIFVVGTAMTFGGEAYYNSQLDYQLLEIDSWYKSLPYGEAKQAGLKMCFGNPVRSAYQGRAEPEYLKQDAGFYDDSNIRAFTPRYTHVYYVYCE